MAATPTRRQRLRVELTEQIIEIGRRQLEEGGVANVHWRGIAEEIGMNPASLYTYVDGINDLYTRILGHSFRSLADAVADAAQAHQDPRTRLIECARAYRAWAVEKPNQFNLIFTNQIPGYTAPTQGDAFDAAMDVNTPFITTLLELIGGDSGNHTSLDALSAEQSAMAYGLRSMMHGFTILEINHQSPYIGGTDDMMINAMSQMIDNLIADQTDHPKR